MKKYISAIIGIFAIFTGLCVYAAGIYYASITISPVGVDGGSITDGEFAIYKVAELKDGILVYEDLFENCGVVLGDLSDTSIADNLDTYAEENSLAGISAIIDESGSVVIGGADDDIIDNYSLYLIRNTVASTGYEKAIPCIVFINNETAEGSVIVSDDTWTVEIIPKLTPVGEDDAGTSGGDAGESSSENPADDSDDSEISSDTESETADSIIEKISTGILNGANKATPLAGIFTGLMVIVGSALIVKRKN